MKDKRVFHVLVMLSVVACLGLLFAGCTRYYWGYDCNWVCNEPCVELYQGCGSRQMVVDGEQYDFFTAQASDATFIEFYLIQEGAPEVQELLWRADTVLKDGTLYLTITEDAVSDLEGATLVFVQKAA